MLNFLQNIDGTQVHRWLGARVTDLAISQDGMTMVAICHEKKIRIYDLEKKTEDRYRCSHCEIYLIVCSIQEDHPITSLCLSQDSRYALVSVSIQVRASPPVHGGDFIDSLINPVHKMVVGNPFMGFAEKSIAEKVHGSETRSVCHSILLWWTESVVCHQWERRYT